MNILLINSGNDSGIASNANAQSYPPLGIISLATHLKANFDNEVEITLLDGQIDDVESIAMAICRERPDLVGVSVYCTSVMNSVRLIKEAKDVGAVTVLGNDQAAFHAETLLRKVPEIDYICLADVGEPCLVDLVSRLLRREQTPEPFGFAWCVNDQTYENLEEKSLNIVNGHTKESQRIMEIVGIPDRSLLPRRYWDEYLKAFRDQFHCCIDPKAIQGVATINRARGCSRFQNPCMYCGIADLRLRGSGVDMFWDDVQQAREQVFANFLYEAFDSATSWPGIIDRWAKGKPEDLEDIKFLMYAQAVESTPRAVKLFRDLGVVCVNMGFDSGDTETLHLLRGPQDSLERNKEAALRWSENGIEIYASFVLMGLGDEATTRRALDRTVEFVEWLVNNSTAVSIDSSLLFPDKNSKIGQWVWEPNKALIETSPSAWNFLDAERLAAISRKLRSEAFVDMVELCADFAKACGVRPEVLTEYSIRLREISRRAGLNFGYSQGGMG